MNYTDVDDKTIKGSVQEKIPLIEFTEKYKKAFLEDAGSLNILPAEVYCAATDHIPEMVKLVEKLVAKGVAYRGDDGCIYFSIKKFPDYGKLAGLDVKKLKAGARVKHDEYEKESFADFALWKAWDENDGAVFWDTSLGKGRPGWHIECSAMSMKYLGEHFDLHTGGIDNKFPHHENEIAQSESATGKKFVNYWLHTAHLMVNGEKMSKSLGNFYTLRDILKLGYNPLAVRFVFLNVQYGQPLNFTFEALRDAQKTLAGIQNFVERLRLIDSKKDKDSIGVLVSSSLEKFEKAMDDNLNVPEAIKHVFEFIKEVNKLIDSNSIGVDSSREAIGFLKKIDSVFGVIDFREKFFELTDEQRALFDEREKARKKKDWKKSDELRNKLRSMGVELVDNKDGSTTAKPAAK
jgi:cysteinyl-tRNA synthetase